MTIRSGKSILLIIGMLLLGGCSLFEDAKQTVNSVSSSADYVTGAATYMQTLTSFSEQATQLAEQAVNDASARADYKEQLVAVQESIKQFGELQAPDFAKDVHQTVVDYNLKLQESIDAVLKQIEDGKALVDATEIPNTINKINELLNQVNQLEQLVS
ncbi:DUF6376 family protein [Paenibacillus algorifonticola]|nr:DUF6376 family protein [Paenibacillus algorifonticola]